MPIPYILLHLLLSSTCLILALRLRVRPWIGRGLGLLVFGFWLLGFASERKPSWAGVAMHLPGSGWVFLLNFSLELVAVLLAVLWRAAEDRKAQQRAAVLSPLLLAAALASYAWYFMPLPAPLTGVAAADGYCPQTSHDSCGAAAAVTLLARHGIRSTEAQMATLCLTRAGQGTPSLGLYRGLWLAAAPSNLRPRLVHTDHLSDLRHAAYPCIISVGLKSDCSPAIQERMISYGWEPGVHHAVVLLGIEANGSWISVADPSYGRERWPIDDLNYLWDGYALILASR